MLGLLFFINMVTPPLIEQTNLDGQHRRRVISERLLQPSALAVDPKDNFIFWADTASKSIETATLTGEDRLETQKISTHCRFCHTGLGLHGYGRNGFSPTF